MMNFIEKFLKALFVGVDPVTVARFVRGFFAAVLGGLSAGVIDVLVQILAQLQSADPFHVNWMLVARTVAIAVIPVIVAFLKQPPTDEQN